jgi:hypothetical protein
MGHKALALATGDVQAQASAWRLRTRDRMPIRHPAGIFLFGQKLVRAGVFRTSWGQSTGHSESPHEFGAAGIRHTQATGPVRAH